MSSCPTFLGLNSEGRLISTVFGDAMFRVLREVRRCVVCTPGIDVLTKPMLHLTRCKSVLAGTPFPRPFCVSMDE